MIKFHKAVASLALAALLAPAGIAVAQDNSDNNTGDRGRERGERGGDRERGPGGPGGFDPARIREFMLNRVKEQLAPSDEEWQVLQPKIEKVMDARQEQMGGFGFGGGGMGGFGGGGRGGREGGQEREPRNASERAVRELRTAIDSNASADQIAAKLTALREARAKAQANFKAAQEDLKGVVTAKQEAQLVLSGMLE